MDWKTRLLMHTSRGRSILLASAKLPSNIRALLGLFSPIAYHECTIELQLDLAINIRDATLRRLIDVKLVLVLCHSAKLTRASEAMKLLTSFHLDEFYNSARVDFEICPIFQIQP